MANKNDLPEPGSVRDVPYHGLTPNSIIPCVLTDTVAPAGYYVVKPVGYEDQPITCLYLTPFLFSLLGLRCSGGPPPKTELVVFYTGKAESYILGCRPHSAADPLAPPASVTDPNIEGYGALKSFQARLSKKLPYWTGHQPPIDLVEGEIDLSNLMNVGITFLRHLASLHAGDLAKVECFLLDDLVRVTSGTWRHHSAFGDERIYADGGRLNVEQHGAAYEHEAYGTLRPEDAKLPEDAQGRPDLTQAQQVEGFDDEGRWRYSQYIGWLGDFINLWVTDPPNVLGQLASDQLRSGKFRCHVSTDGGILVQSVAEVAIEKVVRIPVPMRLRREDDPAGNQSTGNAGADTFNKDWKPQGNIFEVAFQLREYGRWLSNNWSLLRFRQMARDFKVPDEYEVPAPRQDMDDGRDLQAPNTVLAYACIRILRDGAIVWVDAYGNSMHSTANGITLSSARDLTFEAAGSINMMAGRDVNIVAQKNVGISAIQEALRLRAKTGMQFLVEAGNFVMECLQMGWLHLRFCGLNVNGQASIRPVTGNLDANGSITGLRVAAAITNGAFGYNPHMFHIFAGSPAPQELTETDKFKHQAQYDANHYQSMSQSMLARGEGATQAHGDWKLKDNALAGRGAPWPGEEPQQQVAPGGLDLNAPAKGVQSNTHVPMKSEPVTFKTV